MARSRKRRVLHPTIIAAIIAAGAAIIAALIGIIHLPSTFADRSASDIARSVVQRYYNAINEKDYSTAYNIWHDKPYEQFKAGYEDTLHDDITFDSVVPQNDNTVHIDITIHATERNGPVAYHASYVVAKIGDSWEITRGSVSLPF